MKYFPNWMAAGLLAMSLSLARAQVGPDIVWATNAHSTDLTSVSFSGDNMRLASGGWDHHGKVWSVSDGQMLADISYPNATILSTALSSNGTELATGLDNGRTRLKSVQTGGTLWQSPAIDYPALQVAYAPNDQWVARAYSVTWLFLHDAATGQGPIFEGHSDVIGCVAFSPDSQWLASGGEDQTARLWQVTNATCLRVFQHSNSVGSVDFSPDARLLATSSEDGVRFWNVTNGALLTFIATEPYSTAKFSANGKLVVTLANETFRLWRVPGGESLGSITNSGAVTYALSKNGKYLAYGRNDYAVVLAHLPVVIDSITRTGNTTVLNWQGGSGLYQLQSNTNVTTNGWQNLGPATTNTVATNVSSSTHFFRVQSLPNP